MRKASAVLAVIALAAFGLVACGGDDDEDETTAAATTEATGTGGGAPAGGATTLNVSAPADGSFAFDQKSLTAQPGSVTIDFNNPSDLSHDVVVEDESGEEIGKTDLVSGGTASTTVELQPGTYTYYCDVPGHREGGMEGTLTVQ
jgi:plastocyanin